MTPASGDCIFCGEYGPLHDEDPVPRWLSRLLRQFATGPQILHTRSVHDKGKVLREISKKVQSASAYKVPVVCQERCNGGWMSRLEKATKPILTPMILGVRTGLSREHQTTVATWMTLKALFFDLVEKEDQTAEDEDFKRFYREKAPPPRFDMWLAAYQPAPLDVFEHMRGSNRTREERDGIPAGTPHSQTLTLVLGHLVLQSIFVNQATQAYPEVHSRVEPEPHITRIWPIVRAPVDWPPPIPLKPEDIQLFSTGINSDGTPP